MANTTEKGQIIQVLVRHSGILYILCIILYGISCLISGYSRDGASSINHIREKEEEKKKNVVQVSGFVFRCARQLINSHSLFGSVRLFFLFQLLGGGVGSFLFLVVGSFLGGFLGGALLLEGENFLGAGSLLHCLQTRVLHLDGGLLPLLVEFQLAHEFLHHLVVEEIALRRRHVSVELGQSQHLHVQSALRHENIPLALAQNLLLHLGLPINENLEDEIRTEDGKDGEGQERRGITGAELPERLKESPNVLDLISLGGTLIVETTNNDNNDDDNDNTR